MAIAHKKTARQLADSLLFPETPAKYLKPY
jgi:hypothetical protein